MKKSNNSASSKTESTIIKTKNQIRVKKNELIKQIIDQEAKAPKYFHKNKMTYKDDLFLSPRDVVFSLLAMDQYCEDFYHNCSVYDAHYLVSSTLSNFIKKLSQFMKEEKVFKNPLLCISVSDAFFACMLKFVNDQVSFKEKTNASVVNKTEPICLFIGFNESKNVYVAVFATDEKLARKNVESQVVKARHKSVFHHLSYYKQEVNETLLTLMKSHNIIFFNHHL